LTSLYLSQTSASPPIDQFRRFGQLIDPTIKKEDRPHRGFCTLAGGATNGFTALYSDWLHGSWWTANFSDTMALMHEIGHACRLATSKSTASRAQTHSTSCET